MVEKSEGSGNDTVILIVIVLIIAVVILFITGGFGLLSKSPISFSSTGLGMTKTTNVNYQAMGFIKDQSAGYPKIYQRASIPDAYSLYNDNYECWHVENEKWRPCEGFEDTDARDNLASGWVYCIDAVCCVTYDCKGYPPHSWN